MAHHANRLLFFFNYYYFFVHLAGSDSEAVVRARPGQGRSILMINTMMEPARPPACLRGSRSQQTVRVRGTACYNGRPHSLIPAVSLRRRPPARGSLPCPISHRAVSFRRCQLLISSTAARPKSPSCLPACLPACRVLKVLSPIDRAGRLANLPPCY
jgi:hypothetical protein